MDGVTTSLFGIAISFYLIMQCLIRLKAFNKVQYQFSPQQAEAVQLKYIGTTILLSLAMGGCMVRPILALLPFN